jgi:tRNA A37 threonylcarbamoyladenosine synthetase subunit TsaC/SUA5/YrdC
LNSSLVYLTQTDTTVGFLSQNDKKLSSVKQRDNQKKILQVVDTFHTLKKYLRVPSKYKKRIRRAKMTTFIYPNKLAFRVVDSNSRHQNFLLKFHSMYSTSANKTQNSFDEHYAKEKSDIIIYTKNDFSETKASSIYKINKSKIKKIR